MTSVKPAASVPCLLRDQQGAFVFSLWYSDCMKKILFVCMLNAARSQAAEALFRNYASATLSTSIKGAKLSDEWIVESAGMMSKGRLNPYVVEILAKRGISTEGQFSKKIDFSKIREYDKIISFVPFPKGGLRDEDKEKISLWNISDPLGRPFEDTRDIVNMIEEKVRELIKRLNG